MLSAYFFPGRIRRSGPALFPSLLLCASAFVFLFSPVLSAQSSPKQPAKHPSTKSRSKKNAQRTRKQLAPTPDRIREIQQALARTGHYQGEPTGKWDDQSVAAMKNFQEANGLQPTGKIEALSLQKLGLGSPVAGLAAPEPRAPADPPLSSPNRP
jgi:peptidoglycan hydrolase-like protein with peptidoglycan-binding domain